MPNSRPRLPMKQPLQTSPEPPQGGLPIRLKRRPGDPPEPPDWRKVLPAPLRLVLADTLLTFAILSQLPQRPLSIPVAVGLAAAIMFYVQFFARRTGFRLGP